MTAKLKWLEYNHHPMVLYAVMEYDHGAVTPTGLREEHLVPIQHWCEQNHCGRRISFDMFKFRNRKEISAFLLRWA